ncbi:MAG: 50S ribosomal protein L21 [Phycisphaerales bacterium]|nr:MAG: 50S ribosomal protein L21 [Phycisphaerales bacterium]
MYAIIENSGAQRRVVQGDTLWIDLHEGGEAGVGDTITFDKVLVVGEAGGSAKLGTPYVSGATVSAKIIDPMVKGEKLDIHKFKPKTGYRRKTGHRQRYTAVEITGIQG